MQIGFIGLGKMGFNMVERLLEKGHGVTVHDLSRDAVARIVERGASGAASVAALAEALAPPRVVWLMVPAGAPVDAVLDSLVPGLQEGDIVIDGGNSRHTDSVRRAARLEAGGLAFVDVGTSGGLEGARHGACMMVGGSREAYDRLEPLFADLCVEGGFGYMGRSGSGHFVKMVHNGIEYGMMQAMGEGFDLLESSGYGLDYREVSRVWSNGSVIRGWLMELAGNAFRRDARLGYLEGSIADSGEGRWCVEAALEHGVSVPVIAESVFRRFSSRSRDNFSDKVVAALRHEFGGHGFRGTGKGEGAS